MNLLGRRVQRALHLFGSVGLILYIYTPLGNNVMLQNVTEWVLLPLVGLSGFIMWQLPRLKKAYCGAQRRTSVTSE